MADQSNANNYAPANSSKIENSNVSDPLAQIDFNRSKNLGSAEDDLIASLQNRRENCRARQVFEWESARRQIFAFNNLYGAL